MRVDDGDLVIATLQRGGVWRRDPAGPWTVLTESDLRDLITRRRPAAAPSSPRSTARTTRITRMFRTKPGLEADRSTVPHAVDGHGNPHPSNGPPTTYEVCV